MDKRIRACADFRHMLFFCKKTAGTSVKGCWSNRKAFCIIRYMEKKTNDEILKRLSEFYMDAKPALVFTNAFELLVATMLSAQSTDVQVNKVTPALFKRFGTPKVLMGADIAEVEQLIQSVGFYKTKARHLIEASAIFGIGIWWRGAGQYRCTDYFAGSGQKNS